MSNQHIWENALERVGDTPLFRLNRIPQARGIKCNVFAKCEFFNAGGSIKDRIAKLMVEKAEADGRLVPGKSVIIEPTSGNTGVGLSLIAAVKGYRCIIVLPQKMSTEKVNTMRALGSEIIRTPTEAGHDDPRCNINVAHRLAEEIPDAVILDQFGNQNNPLAQEATAQEVIDALANGSLTRGASARKLVDAVFAGVGTGGTISGLGHRLKRADHNPACKVVAIDPVGSTIAEPQSLNVLPPGSTGAYKVEGIGYDFDPDTLDKSVVDQWIKTTDDKSFEMTRAIIRDEGLLIGGSSGAILYGALDWLESETGKAIGQDPEANVVVIMADGIRNYISKDWLIEDAKPVQVIE